MAQNIPLVYQLKVTIKHMKPPIWRRLQVPADYTFDQLHLAIQGAMDWSNSHLYQFTVDQVALGKRSGLVKIVTPGENGFGDINSLTAKLSTLLTEKVPKISYNYDLGDTWYFIVELEKVLPKTEGQDDYPKCVGGRQPSPAEHVVYKDSEEESEDEDIVPKKFDPKAVTFKFNV